MDNVHPLFRLGAEVVIKYSSPPGLIPVRIYLRGWVASYPVYDRMHSVGASGTLEVKLVCAPNNLRIYVGGKFEHELDPGQINYSSEDSPHYWVDLYAALPYNPTEPGPGWREASNEWESWRAYPGTALPHIREVAYYELGKSSQPPFFTAFVQAYEIVGELKTDGPAPEPEPEPEPEVGGNGSSVEEAISVVKLPYKREFGVAPFEVLWFKVQIAVSGDYEFTTASPVDVPDPSRPDTQMTLYASDGTLLDENDDADPDNRDYRSRIVALGLSAGTYYIGIAGSGAVTGDGFELLPDGSVLPDNVTMEVLEYVPPPPPPPPPLTQITLPYREDFPMQEGEYVYWYEFTVPSGMYKIDTGKSAYPGDNDTVMALYDSDGMVVANSYEPGNGDYRDLIETQLSAGTYRLGLAQNGAYFYSGFEVDSNYRLAGGVVLEVKELLEGDGSSREAALWAKPLPFRQDFTAPAASAVLWYEVEFEYGQDAYTIDTKTHSGASVDTFLALFDGAGNLVAKNDSFGTSSPDARAKLTVYGIGGKHYVALGGAGCDASDGFGVQAGASGAPAGTVLEINQDAVAVPSATTLPTGTRSFPDGAHGVQWFKAENTSYYAQGFQLRSMDVSQAGTFVRIALYGSNGRLIDQSLVGVPGDGREYLLRTVSRGTYYIAVAGEGAEFFNGFEAIAPNPLLPGAAMEFNGAW